MIYVTQGHEKSIGLEVFLKSFILLSNKSQKEFTLVSDQSVLEKNLHLLNYEYEINNDEISFCGTKLKVINPKKEELPSSTRSLKTILEIITEDDILLTLPTSKDQLILNDKMCKGYTEYLRTHYDNEELCMLFKAFDNNTLLITDHIPLSEVSKSISEDLIFNKIVTTLECFSKFFERIDEVLISGINPHCGENGLLGYEDKVITKAAQRLNTLLPTKGPISGDTLHFYRSNQKKQLNVYMFHDQGLPVFKDKYKTIGLNITLGLPFLRMSVDHGTAFELYGKGIADFSGCYYMLKEALKLGK
jgi:4-hydroxythreonine-4-phosphate dehydrogenase